jgi:putative RecB family exonuclease
MIEDLRLSVSKTKTFLDCKAKYKFCYIEKLPRKTWDFHVFGKFCHRVLEFFHKQYIDGCLLPYNVTMTDAFKAAWAEFGNDMTPEMKKDCWAIVDQYLRLVTKDKKSGLPANVIDVEKRFDFQIADNLVLNGAIDRIQLDADHVVHVADYKTTKHKKYLKNDFFQLLTYAYVIVSEDPTIEKVRASYILLRHDFEYITTEFSKAEILSVKDKYIEYANKMLGEKEFAPTTSNLCNYCDFQEHCPAGKSMSRDNNMYGEVAW